MYNILTTNTRTGETRIFETVKTERDAERFCEAWGWVLCNEDGIRYWLDYEEATESEV